MGSLLGILLGIVGKVPTVGQAGQNTGYPPPVRGWYPGGRCPGEFPTETAVGKILLGKRLLGIGNFESGTACTLCGATGHRASQCKWGRA